MFLVIVLRSFDHVIILMTLLKTVVLLCVEAKSKVVPKLPKQSQITPKARMSFYSRTHLIRFTADSSGVM